MHLLNRVTLKLVLAESFSRNANCKCSY